MADKEIMVYRRVIRMIFPMIQRAKSGRSLWRALPVYNKETEPCEMKIRNLQENFDDTVESNGKQNTGMEIEEAENNVYEVLEANKSHNIIY